jgi:tetratricopeptide (TPR) repeat protein
MLEVPGSRAYLAVMPTIKGVAVLVSWAALAGCTAVQLSIPSPSPQQIPELEARIRADSTDLDAILLLARGYSEGDRTDQALELVRRARVHLPAPSDLALLEGLYAEEVGDFSGAREAYEEFLSSDPPPSLRDEAEAHLLLVRREELKTSVREALAREEALAETEPDPGAVGVFPFLYEGEDPEWAPLSKAFAELLITDLGVTGRLTVLERVKIQTLLDELALAEAGLVDQETAARSGRILGAGQLVQGRYRIQDARRIGVDAAVVSVGQPGEIQVEPVLGEGEIQGLFDLEKQMALDLHAEMGIQLTPAEEARIHERHTESVQALLAFGRGLSATDEGDFRAAQAHFHRAAELDPGFSLARTRAVNAARSAAAALAQSSLQLQALSQRLIQQKAAIRALSNAPASIRQQILSRLTLQQRAALAELLGQDRVGTAILLELTFVRPGGGS